MPQETTYAGILGDWQRLLVPLKANSEALVQLEGLRVKLEALVERAIALNNEQAATKAAKQQATKNLQALIAEGRRLATLLRVGVREHFGPRAEKLSEFNLQPFRGRPRSVKPAPDGPTPDGPAPGGPAAPGNPPASPSTPLKATSLP